MKENIAIISNYYPPEKGAAANRIEQLALQLQANGYAVQVICPLGNYPFGQLMPAYQGKFQVTENQNGISVSRLWIYPSVSKNKLIRLFSVLSFVLSLSLYLGFKKTPHKVIVQSPPLLLSFVSVALLRLKNKKIILNVSDLWPLAAIELQALKPNSISHRFAQKMEQYIYRNATVILGQSNEILTHIRGIVSVKPTYLYRNFPNHAPQNLDPKHTDGQKIKLFYAGLLGVAQGVLELCQKLELPANMELNIYGDGAEKVEIEKLLNTSQYANWHYHGMLDRNELHQQLQSCDIALIPLKTRIYGSVPSKIFEYSALGFPALYFGGGEGADLVNQHQLGWVAAVGDYDEINEKLIEIAALSSAKLNQMKEGVLTRSRTQFDVSIQAKELIEKGVF
ncbi:MAG: glycosyltransferase family 4 protein [Flavobacterium sp.]|jgi:glycosyltransferase involved in cell wall biosynthesis